MATTKGFLEALLGSAADKKVELILFTNHGSGLTTKSTLTVCGTIHTDDKVTVQLKQKGLFKRGGKDIFSWDYDSETQMLYFLDESGTQVDSYAMCRSECQFYFQSGDTFDQVVRKLKIAFGDKEE